MIIPVLYVVSFLDAFAFVLVISTLNPYIHHLGGTQFYAGVLGSISAFINLIWNPIVGSLGDTVGRKTVLLHCLCICLVGNILAVTSSLTIFFIARIITTFGTQIAVLIKSIVDDNIPNKELKMATMNKIQASSGICFIFGALVAGILSEYENGFHYIWYLICAMFATNIVLVSLVVKNQPLAVQERKPPLAEVTKAFTNLTKIDWPRYWDLFTIKLITDFVFTVLHFNLSYILLDRFGVSGKSLGYVISSLGIMGIVTNVVMPKLKKRIYATDDSGLKRLFHGCFILIVTYLGLGLSPNFFIFYIFLLPFPAGRVLFETTFTEVILARAGPEEKGGVMGALESTLALAGLTAPLISGLVSDKWGTDTVFLLCTIPLTLGTILAYLQKKTTKIQ